MQVGANREALVRPAIVRGLCLSSVLATGARLAGAQQFSVSVIVRPTPNPQFRRMDAQVFDADTPILRISTIIGRN